MFECMTCCNLYRAVYKEEIAKQCGSSPTHLGGDASTILARSELRDF